MPNNIFLETKYTIAVQTIKTVILQSQYQAIKLLNKEQLALMDIGEPVPLLSLATSFKWNCPALEVFLKQTSD